MPSKHLALSVAWAPKSHLQSHHLWDVFFSILFGLEQQLSEGGIQLNDLWTNSTPTLFLPPRFLHGRKDSCQRSSSNFLFTSINNSLIFSSTFFFFFNFEVINGWCSEHLKICIPCPGTGFLSISVYSAYKLVYLVTLAHCRSSTLTPAACWRWCFPAGLQCPGSILSLSSTAPCPGDTCSSWHFFCEGFGCCVAVQCPWPKEKLTHQNTNKYKQIQRI